MMCSRSRMSWVMLALAVVCAGACSGGDDDDDDDGGAERVVLVLPYGGTAPVAGVELLSHDADGAIVGSAVSGSDGVARLVIPEDGSVAALFFEDVDLYIYEVFAPPADVTPVLRVPVAVTLSTPTPQPTVGPVTFDVTVTPGGGVVTSRVSIACDLDVDSDTVVVLTTASFPALGCLGGTTDVVAFGLDGSDAPIAWGHTGGVAVSPGATVPVSVVENQTSFASISASTTDLDSNLDYSISAANLLGGYQFGRRSISGTGVGSGVLEIATGAPFERYSIGAQVFGVDFSDSILSQAFYFRDAVVLAEALPTALTVADADLTHFEQVDLHDRRHPRIDFSTPATGADLTTIGIDWEQGGLRMSYRGLLPPDRSDFRLGDLPDLFSPETMDLTRVQVFIDAADYLADYTDALLGVEPAEVYDRTTTGVLTEF